MLLQMALLCSFLWLSNIPLYIWHIFFFIHSSVGHLGCFHVLAIVNSAAMNTGVHTSFGITIFSRYMPRSYNFTFLCLISSPFSSPPSSSLMSIPILYLVLMCQPQIGVDKTFMQGLLFPTLHHNPCPLFPFPSCLSHHSSPVK